MKLFIFCNYEEQKEWDFVLSKEKDIIYSFNLKKREDIIKYDCIILHKNDEKLLEEFNIMTVFISKYKCEKYDLNINFSLLKDYIDNKNIPYKFNAISNFSSILNFALKNIKNKTKGNFTVCDEGFYTYDEIFSRYPEIKLNKNYEINKNLTIIDKKFNLTLNKNFIINMYTPTYFRFEKTKKSIESIIKYIKKYYPNNIRLYIGDNNTTIPEMKEWLKELNNNYDFVEVHFNEKNIGKANMVNFLHSNSKKCNYVCSIDSDMIIEENSNPFKSMIDVLEKVHNVGLVSSNQKECNQHWFGRGVDIKEERGYNIGYAPDWVGIAGGCIFMKIDDWNNINGYKEQHDIYTGDDGILTYNVCRKLGKRVVVDMNSSLIHPNPSEDEKGYTEWKMNSWKRDGLKFIKDNYKGSNIKGYYD